MAAQPDAPVVPEVSIWWFAFGYFAAYVPYSALTKVLSKGLIEGVPAIDGVAMLPVTVLASVVGMFTFLTVMRWWRFAGRRQVFGRTIVAPSLWTFMSGICTAAIVVTTTLAYTFDGVSIVFVMLLMRGGVLVIAPIVDRLTGRTVRWFSWVGLLLSIAALVVSVGVAGVGAISTACAIDVGIYLASYFLRLRFMSRNAKGSDPDASRRYFVEEQMVATPFAVIFLGAIALFGAGPFPAVREGFTAVWSHPALWILLGIGILSQFTGIFGGLILLDKRENTYCVPVNRASSVLAGVVAASALTLFLGQRFPPTSELVGAGLVIAAIVVLSVPPLLEARRKKRAAAGS